MRVLFLTHRLPYAPNRGDRIRAYHLLRQLSRSAEVDVLSLVHDDEEASHTDELTSLAASLTTVRVPRIRNLIRSVAALPTATPTTHTMLDAPDLVEAIQKVVQRQRPSVVLAYCSGMARLALQPPLDDIPFVLDMVDVDSSKWADLSKVASPPRSWIFARESRVLAQFEARAASGAFATMVVTDKEERTLRGLAPEANVEVVPNGVDTAYWQPPHPPSSQPNVVFCGVMNYQPNEEGALWLANHVWPLVRARRPDARLVLVGSHPTPQVEGLRSASSGIDVTGAVPDVRPFLWDASVAAAPLLRARGVQNKVLEAVAAGIPAVVTPVVFEGLPLEVRPACVCGGEAAAFADAIVKMLDCSPGERRAHASRASLASLTWESTLQRAGQLLQEAAAAS